MIKYTKLLIFICLIFTSTSCIQANKVDSSKIEELNSSQAKEIFKIKKSCILFFAGKANIMPNKVVPFVIFSEEISGEPAFVQIKSDKKIYTLRMQQLNFFDFKVNKVFVKKVTDFPYPQLIVDYYAGSAGTQGWTGQSYLYIFSWMGDKFEIILEHLIFEENHYSYNESIKTYSYKFAEEKGLKKVIFTDQDGVKEEFVWKGQKFVKVK